MPPRSQWTLERLERACRKEFAKRASLKVGALGANVAEVEWEDNGRIEVKVDDLFAGRASGTLHEMVHTILERELLPFAEYVKDRKGDPVRDLAELAIDVWVAALVQRIMMSKRRTAWWRAKIRRKTVK